jgi:rare lipoprotein A
MKPLPRPIFLPALCALVALVSGCATPRRIITDPAPSAFAGDSPGIPAIFNPKPVSVLQGKASYYWEPQPTASGERFNPRAFTAAHKTLPMHSVVRVINVRNGKSVVVRINDRGPYVRGRIIDLSKAAAEKISMVSAGVVPVKIEVFRRIDLMTKPNKKLKPTTGKRKRTR